MTKNTGVWIDHRKAIIVTLTESGEELTQINSDVEKQVRSASGSRSRNPEGPQRTAPEDTLQRKFTQQLNDYYKQVIACIGEAKSVVILGPGEAKLELKKQVKSKDLLARIKAVETADKMTAPQLKAKVRAFFEPVGTR